jgi:hypothetical protein
VFSHRRHDVPARLAWNPRTGYAGLNRVLFQVSGFSIGLP